MVDEEDGDNVKVLADSHNLPNDSHSTEYEAIGPSDFYPNLEFGNDDHESKEQEKNDQAMLDGTVEE